MEISHFFLFSTKESWLVNGLFEFYVQSGSPRCLELLLNVREPHERFLFDKMAEGIKTNQDKSRQEISNTWITDTSEDF